MSLFSPDTSQVYKCKSHGFTLKKKREFVYMFPKVELSQLSHIAFSSEVKQKNTKAIKKENTQFRSDKKSKCNITTKDGIQKERSVTSSLTWV